MLDLRYPSGLFFAGSGLLLVILGLTSDPQAPLTSSNVDLYTGLAMVAFGGLLLCLAIRSRRNHP